MASESAWSGEVAIGEPAGVTTAPMSVLPDDSVRVPQWAVMRLGLEPGDRAVIAAYRGIVMVARKSPGHSPSDLTYVSEQWERVSDDGTMTVGASPLSMSGLLDHAERENLTLTVWGDEISIS